MSRWLAGVQAFVGTGADAAIRETIGQFMILRDFIEMAPASLATAKRLLRDALEE